jgi:hypothetical protein
MFYLPPWRRLVIVLCINPLPSNETAADIAYKTIKPLPSNERVAAIDRFYTIKPVTFAR